MGNKEDWEDVEKSVRKAEEEKLKSYKGIDITEMLKRKNIKSKNNISGEIIKFVSKRLIVIFTIISIFIIITIVWAYLDSMRNAHDIDVKQHIESFQHIKINQIYENLDEGEHNGEYCFEIKKYPLIKFKAIKHFGQEKNDLIDQLNKYLFDNWNSYKKDRFEIIENKNEEGLLEFKAYLTINTYEELIEGTQIIIEFLKYTEEWNEQNDRIVDLWQQKEGQFVMPMYNIYLMKDNKPIVPHSALFQTADEIMENAKQTYNSLISE